jgi:hypothetical protein
MRCDCPVPTCASGQVSWRRIARRSSDGRRGWNIWWVSIIGVIKVTPLQAPLTYLQVASGSRSFEPTMNWMCRVMIQLTSLFIFIRPTARGFEHGRCFFPPLSVTPTQHQHVVSAKCRTAQLSMHFSLEHGILVILGRPRSDAGLVMHTSLCNCASHSISGTSIARIGLPRANHRSWECLGSFKPIN